MTTNTNTMPRQLRQELIGVGLCLAAAFGFLASEALQKHTADKSCAEITTNTPEVKRGTNDY